MRHNRIEGKQHWEKKLENEEKKMESEEKMMESEEKMMEYEEKQQQKGEKKTERGNKRRRFEGHKTARKGGNQQVTEEERGTPSHLRRMEKTQGKMQERKQQKEKKKGNHYC